MSITLVEAIAEIRTVNDIKDGRSSNPEYLRGQVEFAAMFCTYDGDAEATRAEIYEALGIAPI